MSLWVLDTDILTLFHRGHARVCQRVGAVDPRELAITIVSVEEMLTGWYTELRRAKTDKHLAAAYASLHQAVEFLRTCHILPFTESSARQFRKLRTVHRRLGTNDPRIAAIVLEAGGVLVTRNTGDFGAIDGLTIEDWAA